MTDTGARMTIAQLDIFGGETVSPTIPDGPRVAYSCDRCAEWFFSVEDVANDWGRSEIPCPICNGSVTLRGRVEDGRAVADTLQPICDDRCTGARGTHCDCHCGGRNHGSGRWVVVTVDLGGRPKFDLSGSPKLAALSVKRLPELERAEELAAALVDLLEQRYRSELAGYRESRWLDAGEYARIREWQGYRDAIRHAQKLKVPANRVRRLEELTTQFNRST